MESVPTKAIEHIQAVQRITRRIDAIGERHTGGVYGLSWWYIKLIFLTGIGWAMDAMETLVFVYVLDLISKDIPMSKNQANFLVGAAFVGSFFGSFGAGSLSDKYGRRPIFMLTAFIFLAGLGLCAVAPNITWLTIFRIISGIGLGGELPVISTLVQELSPKKTRGKIIVLLESFWAVGGVLAVILAYHVAPHTGWRDMFLLCLIPIIYSIGVRWMVPESPKWLASVGRWEEAVAIVEKMEQAHGLAPYDEKKELESAPEYEPPVVLPETHIGRIALLFRSVFRVRTIVLWTLWFGISLSYYAIFILLPGLVAKAGGFNMNSNSDYILIIIACQLPGYFSASWFVEYIGRKRTLVLYLFGSFASAVAFAYVVPTKLNIMTTGGFMSFFLLGAWGCVYSYTPENYPTAIRGIGSAYPAGFSRIGAFWGSYLCSDLLALGFTLKAIMWVFGGVLLFIGAVVLIFGFEPRGKNIETYGEDDEKEGFKATTTPF